MRKAPQPATAINWTPSEWEQLAWAWARDELEHREDSSQVRWKRLVPRIFPTSRQRPAPKARIEERAGQLFALLPKIYRQLKAETSSGTSQVLETQESSTKELPSAIAPASTEEAKEAVSTPLLSPSIESAAVNEHSPRAFDSLLPQDSLGMPDTQASAPQASIVGENTAKIRRIFWTYDERMAFAKAYVESEALTPRMPAVRRIAEVQDALVCAGGLDPSRRRKPNVAAILNAVELKPLLEQARLELKEATENELLKKVTSIATEPLAQQNAAIKATSADSASATGNTGESQGDAPAAAVAQATDSISHLSSMTLLQMMLGVFLGEMLSQPRVQEALKSVLHATLKEVLAQGLTVQQGASPLAGPEALSAKYSALQTPASGESAHLPPKVTVTFPSPRSSPSPAKKRLLVVGLLGSQQTEVESSYGQHFDLRFLTQDDSATRMEQNAKGCDITIGMVGYLSHPTERHLKKASPDYRRCNGTVGDLKRMLHGLSH